MKPLLALLALLALTSAAKADALQDYIDHYNPQAFCNRLGGDTRPCMADERRWYDFIHRVRNANQIEPATYAYCDYQFLPQVYRQLGDRTGVYGQLGNCYFSRIISGQTPDYLAGAALDRELRYWHNDWKLHRPYDHK